MTDWDAKIHAFLHPAPVSPWPNVGSSPSSADLLAAFPVPGTENARQPSGLPAPFHAGPLDPHATREITHPVSPGRLELDLTPDPTSGMPPDPAPAPASAAALLRALLPPPTTPSKARFFALFEALRRRLVRDEPTLRGTWNRVPADPRMPDTSIWHRSALASALATAGPDPCLFAFSLRPVRRFLLPPATLEEFGAGALVLSYLVWTALRVICDHLGPDHVLYPAISDQPLFHHWLRENNLVTDLPAVEDDALGIPSFSNRFVAVLPGNSASRFAELARAAVSAEWQQIATAVLATLRPTLAADDPELPAVWERQNSPPGPWLCDWATAPWDTSNPVDYLAAHALAERRLSAARRATRAREAPAEPGAPCTQCARRQCVSTAAPFWHALAARHRGAVSDTDRLCSICLTRRLLPAAADLLPPALRQVFRHAARPVPAAPPPGRPCALLVMDGDHMSNLVAGRTAGFASWRDVVHSALPRVAAADADFMTQRRTVTPAVHFALSEALAGFSLHTAPYVVRKHGGRVLYVGGDDVMAALPAGTALAAARGLRDLYRSPFVVRKTDGAIAACGPRYRPAPGEVLLLHPGPAASLSAAILIADDCHPIGLRLPEARRLLDEEAKERAGRDAIAVSVWTTSGRRHVRAHKWDDDAGRTAIEELLRQEGLS